MQPVLAARLWWFEIHQQGKLGQLAQSHGGQEVSGLKSVQLLTQAICTRDAKRFAMGMYKLVWP